MKIIANSQKILSTQKPSYQQLQLSSCKNHQQEPQKSSTSFFLLSYFFMTQHAFYLQAVNLYGSGHHLG